MRLNVRRIVIVFGLVIVIYLVYSIILYIAKLDFSSAVLKRYVSNEKIEDFDVRLSSLESEVQQQILQSKSFLQTLKDKIRKEDERRIAMEAKKDPVLAVLVIACNRVTVRRALDSLTDKRPSKSIFPIVVSQDCNHRPTYEVIQEYVQPDSGVSVVKQPNQTSIDLPRDKEKFRGYYNIARHYKFALNYMFEKLGYENVLIVEDDLDVSPDFFEYFLGTYPLLLKDPSLWCISAWNDNGKEMLIDHGKPELLHRTDFFPGLGWMLQKHTWLQLEPKWPQAYFDDWLREPAQINGKACIRPEISRTSTFGRAGVSKGMFFDNHLRYIQLNNKFVPFTQLNLTYLIKEVYDRNLEAKVKSLPIVRLNNLTDVRLGDVQAPYKEQPGFKALAKKLGLMEDFRGGVPRTAYKGIVSCFHQGRRIYLVPES